MSCRITTLCLNNPLNPDKNEIITYDYFNWSNPSCIHSLFQLILLLLRQWCWFNAIFKFPQYIKYIAHCISFFLKKEINKTPLNIIWTFLFFSLFRKKRSQTFPRLFCLLNLMKLCGGPQKTSKLILWRTVLISTLPAAWLARTMPKLSLTLPKNQLYVRWVIFPNIQGNWTVEVLHQSSDFSVHTYHC